MKTSIALAALGLIIGPSLLLVSPASAGCGTDDCTASPGVQPSGYFCVQTGFGPVTCKVYSKKACTWVTKPGNIVHHGFDYTLVIQGELQICSTDGTQCEDP